MFEVNGFRRVGYLGLNCLPQLKSLSCRYPQELKTTGGHYELQRAYTQKFNKITLVNVPDTLAGQCAALVPKFSEWHFRNDPLVRAHRSVESTTIQYKRLVSRVIGHLVFEGFSLLR